MLKSIAKCRKDETHGIQPANLVCPHFPRELLHVHPRAGKKTAPEVLIVNGPAYGVAGQ